MAHRRLANQTPWRRLQRTLATSSPSLLQPDCLYSCFLPHLIIWFDYVTCASHRMKSTLALQASILKLNTKMSVIATSTFSSQVVSVHLCTGKQRALIMHKDNTVD